MNNARYGRKYINPIKLKRKFAICKAIKAICKSRNRELAFCVVTEIIHRMESYE